MSASCFVRTFLTTPPHLKGSAVSRRLVAAMTSQPGTGSQGFSPNTVATQQFLEQRATYQTAEYKAVQTAFFGPPRVKRSAPTPVHSGLTTPQEGTVADEVMRDAAEFAEPPEERHLLTPFSLQDQAALQVTLGTIGVDINDQNAIQAWGLQQPANNAEIFQMVRAYHEKVIRPEYYSLICQLEAGLKAVDDRCFQVKKEVAWMASENRQLQKHACGLQLLATGWPNALKPEERVYMLSWMVSQVPSLVTFLKQRGYVTDHNASELERHMNVFFSGADHSATDRGVLLEHDPSQLRKLGHEDCVPEPLRW